MNRTEMSNLDVALAGFWQIARHWKNGDKAKIELSCEAGSLYMQLSAMLGHPDQPHFPILPYNHTNDQNKDFVHDFEPVQVTVSFQCDQC